MIKTGNELLKNLHPSQLVIVESWRKVERPLPPRTRILKVWKSWRSEQKYVKYFLKPAHRYKIVLGKGKTGLGSAWPQELQRCWWRNLFVGTFVSVRVTERFRLQHLSPKSIPASCDFVLHGGKFFRIGWSWDEFTMNTENVLTYFSRTINSFTKFCIMNPLFHP